MLDFRGTTAVFSIFSTIYTWILLITGSWDVSKLLVGIFALDAAEFTGNGRWLALHSWSISGNSIAFEKAVLKLMALLLYY